VFRKQKFFETHLLLESSWGQGRATDRQSCGDTCQLTPASEQPQMNSNTNANEQCVSVYFCQPTEILKSENPQHTGYRSYKKIGVLRMGLPMCWPLGSARNFCRWMRSRSPASTMKLRIRVARWARPPGYRAQCIASKIFQSPSEVPQKSTPKQNIPPQKKNPSKRKMTRGVHFGDQIRDTFCKVGPGRLGGPIPSDHPGNPKEPPKLNSPLTQKKTRPKK